jgi:hypothetical protein
MTGVGTTMRVAASLSALVALAGVLAASSRADDPPGTTVEVTVTTPLTAPPPDPAPRRPTPKPTPAPVARPKPHVVSKPKTASSARTHRRVVTPVTRTHVVRPRQVQAPIVVRATVGTHAAASAARQARARAHARARAKAKAHARARAKARAKAKAKAKARAKAQALARARAQARAQAQARAHRRQATPLSAQPAAAQTSGGTSGVLLGALLASASVLMGSVLLVAVRRRHAAVGTDDSAAVMAGVPVAARPLVALDRTAPAAHEPDLVEAPVETGEPERAPAHRCRITAWRGYTKWCFYGRIEADGEPVSLVESRGFRATGTDEPDHTPAAVAALEELTARLESDGWQRVESEGGSWFEVEFLARVPAVGAPEAVAGPSA